MISHTSDFAPIRAASIGCYTPDCDTSITLAGDVPLPAGWRVVGITRRPGDVPHEYRYFCPACAARETVRVMMTRRSDGRWGLAT